ncbi:MAG: hypothetical protein LRY57_04265 [Alphaproteobacteria bacterium]|nr:hypothetical protein [Alphaproteobacteria bacterium]
MAQYYLDQGSRNAIKEGPRDLSNYYDFRTSIIYTAFMLESYVQHMGRVMHLWHSSEEQDLRLDQKLERLHRALKLNFSTYPPLQQHKDIFKLITKRNKYYAHSQDVDLQMEGNFINEDEATLSFHDYCAAIMANYVPNEKEARRFFNITTRFIRNIHMTAIGCGKYQQEHIRDIDQSTDPFESETRIDVRYVNEPS